MKPKDVKKANEEQLLKTVYAVSVGAKEEATFKVGDKVRISKLKGIFEKGYTANWSTEIFEIKEVVYSDPITYKLKDVNNEEIKGNFYTQELQKTKYPEAYLVEKVLRKKGNRVYVKWLGFDHSHNSWINKENVIL